MSGTKLSKTISAASRKNAGKSPRLRLNDSKVGPVSTMDMGKFGILRSLPVADRKNHANVLEKVKGFNQLRIHPVIRENIETKVLNSSSLPPTPVQKLVIKALRKPRADLAKTQPWLIAAETGSGKTLSYLAPLLSSLVESKETPTNSEEISQHQHEEEEHQRELTRTESGNEPSIQSIVLVPTTELAHQVEATIKNCLTDSIGLRIRIAAGLNCYTSTLAQNIAKGLDVVVATPDKLLKLTKENPLLMQRALEKCHTLVVDEADSLMNKSFESSTAQVIDNCLELRDLIFVSATIPNSFDKLLRRRYPDINFLVTPSIHRLPRHIDFRVVEVWHRPYQGNKMYALQQALYSIYYDKSEEGKTKRVVVFVNLKRDVDIVVNTLKKAGYDASGLNQDRSNLAEFLDSESFEDDSPRMKVLVATDVVARGIDFNRLRNVILYDMPPNAADLLHRSGRTGRLGRKGRVVLLVSKSESRSWVKGLEKVVKRGMALA